jgi:hypothetical protein
MKKVLFEDEEEVGSVVDGGGEEVDMKEEEAMIEEMIGIMDVKEMIVVVGSIDGMTDRGRITMTEIDETEIMNGEIGITTDVTESLVDER